MANELKANYNGSANLYAIIRNRATSYVWNGTSFVAWADADIASYDVALTSRGGDLYSASMPAAVSEGDYFVDYYKREGATPATTDLRLSGESLHWTGTAAIDSGDDPTAAEMVSLLKQALRDSPAGVSMITIDGQQVQYSRSQALQELKYWEQKAALASGTRRRIASIDLSGF
jgi:hypothetical protein